MKQSQRVVKNVLAGGVSTAAGGLMQLAAVLLVARWLTVAEFGTYAFMVSLAFILQRLADLGVTSILVRDMAVEPSRIGELLGIALSLAWAVCAAVVMLMTLAIFLLPVDRRMGVLTLIMGIGSLSQFQCNCYGSVLISQEENDLQSSGFILHKISLLLTVLVALGIRSGLPGVVTAHLLSSIFQWRFNRWIVVKRYVRPRLSFNIELWKRILADSIPMGATNVVRLVSEQVDILILTALTNLQVVGLYSGPYKLCTGLRFIPLAMVLALFPVYSRAAGISGSRAEFQEMYERGARGFLLLGAPVAVVFLCAPATLTSGLLGAHYLAAAPVMRLLGIGVLLLFVGSPFPFLLTALGQQRFLFVSSAIAFVLRASLDLAWTPVFGFLGPCWAVIVSETFLIMMWTARLWSMGYTLALGKILWRPCLAGLVMAVIIEVLRARSLISLAPIAIAAAAVYLIVIVKLGAISEDELEMGKEGIYFVRPYLAQWSRQLRSGS